MRRQILLILALGFWAFSHVPVHAADMKDVLLEAIPVELIPEPYQSHPDHLNGSEIRAGIGYYPANTYSSIEFRLLKLAALDDSRRNKNKEFWLKGSPGRINIARNLGIGNESVLSIMKGMKSMDGSPQDVIKQEVNVLGNQYLIYVSVFNYDRREFGGRAYFSDAQARKLVIKLAKAFLNNLEGEPELETLHVEQRHLDYGRAKLSFVAKATYPEIGNYDTGDITFIVRMSGAEKDAPEFDAYAPQVKQQGQHLILAYSWELTKPGDYRLEVTLRDKRYTSSVSNQNLQVALKSRLSQTFSVNRPIAIITDVQHQVAIMRHDRTTTAGGATVDRSGRLHYPVAAGISRSTLNLIDDYFPTNADFKHYRRWESLSVRTTDFVYEGDRFFLWGDPSPDRYVMPENTEDFDIEAFKTWLRIGCSSVVLEWEYGVRGEALWNPNKANLKSPSGASFMAGATRGDSGNWQRSWKEWFGDTSRMLLQQGFQQAKDKGIDWFLKLHKLPTVPAAVNHVLMFFSATGGGTIYDDLVYINLESDVYISSNAQETKVFTFEGSPRIIVPERNQEVTVRPNQVASVRPDILSVPASFEPADLLTTQKPADAQPRDSALSSDGDLEAISKLAWDYLKGRNGKPRDEARAFELFNRGCDGGLVKNCVTVAWMYYNGKGVEQDLRKAALYYRNSCEDGYYEACTDIGNMFRKGKGIAKDLKKATVYYEIGCRKGVGESCDWLGRMVAQGKGIEKDHARAVKLFQHGCNKGYAFSCGNLGVMYAKGWGVERNRNKAATLYRRACDAGFDDHCGNLGYAYSKGWGVEKSVTKAIPLLEKGCAKGHDVFCNRLEEIR